MAILTPLTGVILAGGKSKRMGRDKALIEWKGKSLLQHVIDGILPACDKIILISSDPVPLQRFNLPVYPDLHPGLGPLAGLESGLTHAGTYWILLAACDMPLIDGGLIKPLLDGMEKYDAVFYETERGLEPLFALYNKKFLPVILEMMADKNYALHHIPSKIKSHIINLRKKPAAANLLKNFNNPDDLN